MTDHRRGLTVARRLEARATVPIPAPDVCLVDRADLAAAVVYAKALALHGRCMFDVASQDALADGNTRCALPADDWVNGDGRKHHSGPCMTWEGHQREGKRLNVAPERDDRERTEPGETR